MGKNYYELLGVSKAATTEEIENGKKRAIEEIGKRAKKDSILWKLQLAALEEAYETLSKPEKRAAYDQKLEQEAPGKTRTNGFGLLLLTLGITVIVIALANPNLSVVPTTVFVVMGIVAIMISRSKLREPIPFDKETGFQTNDGQSSRRLIVIIGIIFGFVLAGLPNSQSPTDAGKGQKPATQASTPKNSDAVLDSCFLAGKSAAEVYIANFVQLAKENILASEVMEQACTKKGQTAPDPSSCSRTCEMGFKAAARKALK